jgi:hypothetical protein
MELYKQDHRRVDPLSADHNVATDAELGPTRRVLSGLLRRHFAALVWGQGQGGRKEEL